MASKSAIGMGVWVCLFLWPVIGLAQRPNILVILCDDAGWGDFSCNGNPDIRTPAIDSLARHGVQMTQFLVCPVCSPTRAEFLTGRFYPRSNVFSTSAGGERMDLDEITVADYLRRAGYRTGAFGKWHNGTQYPYHPLGRGFDHFYGFTSGHWGDYFSPRLDEDGQPTKGNGYCADDFTDHAIAFMQRVTETKQPFFTYLAFNTPHSPMQVPDSYWEAMVNQPLAPHRYQAQADNEHRRAALAMCQNIDDNVQRLLDFLDREGLAQNTVVIFFSDNGPNGWRWNGGLRGRKGSTDEGGIRSPFLARWPGQLPAGKKIDQVASVRDLLPTLCQWADVAINPDQQPDGRSLASLLTGTASEWPERELVSSWNGKISVRSNDFCLDSAGRLYNLENDPGQRINVRDQFVGRAERMERLAENYRTEILSQLDRRTTRPLPVGYPEMATTELPARDGRPIGNITRSNRFPNDSYFTGWQSGEDAIEWDIQVAQSGRYQVRILGTVPEEAVGARLELSFGQQRSYLTLAQAWDPPLRGAEIDRVVRVESYTKAFRWWEMDPIVLERGSGVLRLRAVEIPAGQVMDLRTMTLTLLDDMPNQ